MFIGINESIKFCPSLAKPISVLSFVQVYVVKPPEFESNSIGIDSTPSQRIMSSISFTCAVGLTVMVKVLNPQARQ